MKVLITGGQGTMAQAIADTLKSFGMTVLTPGRDELDVTNAEDVSSYYGKEAPDIMIYTAGYIKPATIVDSDIVDVKKHFEVNTLGFFYCAKYGISHGVKKFIYVGSTSSFEGRESWGSYCAAKAATMSLTESLSREGYECYNIHPARTATKMRTALFPNEDPKTLMAPERVAEFVQRCLAGEFKPGSQIILKKDYYYVLPERTCLK
jgi:3-oxoacyl-[acyl-carrier protein] reductase